MSHYEIRVKAAAVDNLKAAREQVLHHLGNQQVGERLAQMSEAEAGLLANDLLNLLDAVDGVLRRAERVG